MWSERVGQTCVPGDEELYTQQIKPVDHVTAACWNIKKGSLDYYFSGHSSYSNATVVHESDLPKIPDH